MPRRYGEEVSRLHERLSQGSYDRLSARRTDEDWLAERWADAATRVLVVAGARVRPPLTWVAPTEAPDGLRLLLGERDGVAHFAVIVPREVATEGWVGLRDLLPALLDDGEIAGDEALVMHAFGMAEWLAATRFCARCGRPLRARKEAHELVCDEGHTTFPRTDPAVIMLITDGEPGAEDERCLLGRQARWPERRFSTLAGFCEPGESLEDAVRREVLEEVGVPVGEVTWFGNQPWPLPASLMLGFFGRAAGTDIACDEDEIVEAGWFTRAQLKAGAEDGSLQLPGPVSISRALIETWYGGKLPGTW
jgi:NAD+ diphosphatase